MSALWEATRNPFHRGRGYDMKPLGAAVVSNRGTKWIWNGEEYTSDEVLVLIYACETEAMDLARNIAELLNSEEKKK